MKLPTKKLLFALVVLVIGAVLIITFNAHKYTISPDGYEYLLAARSFVETGRLDTTIGNSYWAPSVLTSRLGYSLVMGLIGQISQVDLIVIAKLLGIILFCTNSLLTLWLVLKRFKHTSAMILWAMFVLSYSTLFWSGLISSDLFGQTLIILSLVYLFSKVRNRYLEIVLYATTLLIRWELILPILVIVLMKYENKKLIKHLINITGAIFIVLTIILLTVSRPLELMSLNFPSGTINISLPFALASLCMIVAAVAVSKFYNLKLHWHYVLILAFLLLGVGFLDAPDFSASLENLWFWLTHEIIIVLVLGFCLWWVRKQISVIGLGLVLIFLAGFITYHFYFQHITMLLPLAYFAGIAILDKHPLPKLPNWLFAAFVAVPLYTLVAFLHYHISQPDLYLNLDKVTEITNCMRGDFIATNFVSQSAYYFFDQREAIYPVSEITIADAVLVDQAYANENREVVTNFSKLNFNDRILISGTTRYSPNLYFSCPSFE